MRKIFIRGAPRWTKLPESSKNVTLRDGAVSPGAAGDRVRHFRLTFSNGKFNIGTNQFNSFDQLIHHYTFNPIFKKDNELLKLVEHVRDSS